VDGLRTVFVVARAVILRDDHACARGKPMKNPMIMLMMDVTLPTAASASLPTKVADDTLSTVLYSI
jgi:hypothetical protein